MRRATPAWPPSTFVRSAAGAALALLVAPLGGCKEDSAAPSPAARPDASVRPATPDSPPTLPGLTVEGDAAARPVRTALAYAGASSRVHLVLTSRAIGCDALARAIPADATHIELELAPKLEPKGSLRWEVDKATVGQAPASVAAGAVTARDTDVESAVSVSLDVSLDAGRLRIAGPVDATPCGRRVEGAPAARPQPDLHLSVAGRTFDVRGAVLAADGDDRYSLTLSTAAHGCDLTDAVGDVELKLTATASPPAVTGAYLFGELIDAEIRVDDVADRISLTLGAPTDAGVPFTVEGRYPHRGLEVALEGTGLALGCPDR
jgi:hypothetical protein